MIAECEESMARADYEHAEIMAHRLLEYGEKTHSDRLRSFANAYIGAFYMSRGRIEEGVKMLDEAREWAEENKNDSVMAIALNGLGIRYAMADNNLVVALKFFNDAKIHAEKASMPLLRLRIENNVIQSAIIRNDTTMLDYAVSCFDEAKKLPVLPAMPLMARHIARLLILKGDFAGALAYLDKADEIGSNGDKDRIVGEMLRGEIFLRQQQYGKAGDSYTRALRLSEDITQRIEAYTGLSRVKLGAKDFEGCKEYASKVRALADEAGITAYDMDYYAIIKEACAELGQWQEAYTYSDKLNKCISEQANADNEYIQKQITTAMQVERKEQEAEMRRQELQAERRRNIVLGASLVLVILLSVFLILEIRKKNRLYRTIVRQFREAISEGDNLRKQLRLREASDTGSKDSAILYLPAAPIPEGEDDTDTDLDNAVDDGKDVPCSLDAKTADELWRALMNEMEENKVYLEMGLTRESLAKLLGTNRTYLSKIIYAHTGMGYTQFINNWRIDEAVRILSDPTRSEYPLKAICQDIGFSSMTTFYKIFKERTGMTPSVFRKNA